MMYMRKEINSQVTKKPYKLCNYHSTWPQLFIKMPKSEGKKEII
jgi:hypothetical protein